jgi:SAM-dependent methyltransferase
MDPDELALMRAAEDGHWWYRGLRGIVRLHWDRHVDPAQRRRRPRLLDVGCGAGGNLAALARAAEPFGIDASPAAVALCRARGLHATAVATAAALPFADAAFDVVLCCDVLGHRSLPDRRAPLAEIARVLRPGVGLLLLNLPAYQALLSPHDAAYGQDRRFTRAEASGLLAGAGLEVVSATHWNALLLPAAAAARLWRRVGGDRGRPGSDLARRAGGPPGLGAAALGLERLVLRLAPLPAGLSVFLVARRP